VKKREVFLQSEGDAWFLRNQQGAATQVLPDDDLLLREAVEVLRARGDSVEPQRVLEVGCSDGARLAWLKDHLHAECYGIEPSAKAVAAARVKGLRVLQGTADELPFDSRSFDVVIFGYCLCWCDVGDLFRIASEADRVLRGPGWLLIGDFFSPTPTSRAYHHHPGVETHKMDRRQMFTWHPSYECMTHKVRHHHDESHTDDRDEWVAVSVLRKLAP
jgi:SAM-dependent methyltransferase